MASSSLRERSPGEFHSGKRKHKRHHRRRHHDFKHASVQSASCPKQDNPIVTVQPWDTLPDSEKYCDDQGVDNGLTFKAVQPESPIEMQEIDVDQSDPTTNLLPIPAGSEPVKDLRSTLSALEEGSNQEQPLLQSEISIEGEHVRGKLQHQDELV